VSRRAAKFREAMEEWRIQWPDSPMRMWREETNASGGALLDRRTPPTSERLRRLDQFLEICLDHDRPERSLTQPPVEVLLASFYVRWNIRLEQVPELLEQGWTEARNIERYRARLYGTVGVDLVSKWSLRDTEAQIQIVRADYYLNARDLTRAKEVIEKGVANAHALHKEQPMVSKEPLRSYPQDWELRQGRLYELMGDAPRALSHFRRYLADYSSSELRSEPPVEYLPEIRRYYQASGASPESFERWIREGPMS
jgi:tetratricopeptide (TPR) repeat protein